MAIAADATDVYWTTYGVSGTVMKVAIGGNTPITLASGQDYPRSIAVDATNVYWANHANAMRPARVSIPKRSSR